MSYYDRYYKNEGKNSWCVYILYLENDKWYVGLTHDVNRRFAEHAEGLGAQWTKLYKPIEIVHIWQTSCYKKAQAEDIENKTTIEMMRVFGKENVRGGYFVSVNQDDVDELLGEELCDELEETFIRQGKKYFNLVKPQLSINRFDEINRNEKRNKYLQGKIGTNGVKYSVTSDRREIRISFPGRPDASTIREMKKGGWNYMAYAHYWNNSYNSFNLNYAKRMCGEKVTLSELSWEEEILPFN